MRKFFIIIGFIFLSGGAFSQELLCSVQIQSQQIQGVDPSVFDAMEKSIFEFMNNRKWTDYNFQIEERIEFTMIITLTSALQGGDEFGGTLNLVYQRPIYGSDYNSVVLNIVDGDIKFAYTPFQPMEYADNTYTDNLTSILAFYAYLVIGMDFDTFSLYGGTPFYEKANAVVQVASSQNMDGWQVFDGPQNRAQLIENILNTSNEALRTLVYEYHRDGLDVMTEKVEMGREVITNSLKNFKVVYDKRPNLYFLQVLLQAKRQEIINIYSEATPAEKVAMTNIMKVVDPAYGTKYDEVLK